MNWVIHRQILEVVTGLHLRGSWTGKTHVQKTFALLSGVSPEVTVPFVLYKHGPFSFELADEIDLMVSYWGLSREPLPPFGVRLSPGQNRAFVESSAELSPTLRAAIEQVVSFVGKRGVVDLERLATTAWIRTRERITDRQAVARRLRALKPHIPLDAALAAFDEVGRILRSN